MLLLMVSLISVSFQTNLINVSVVGLGTGSLSDTGGARANLVQPLRAFLKVLELPRPHGHLCTAHI